MKFKHHIFYRALSCFLLTAHLLTVAMPFAWAEEGDEGEEEEVYIPEEYYEPVQSNAVAGWPEGQAIQAAAGVVMDLDTGAFLYSKNCDRQLYPASITKIMTCLLTLENADLDAVMTCSPIVYELDENASNVGLSEGEMISVRDALYTLMLESANDTANALAGIPLTDMCVPQLSFMPRRMIGDGVRSTQGKGSTFWLEIAYDSVKRRKAKDKR